MFYGHYVHDGGQSEYGFSPKKGMVSTIPVGIKAGPNFCDPAGEMRITSGPS